MTKQEWHGGAIVGMDNSADNIGLFDLDGSLADYDLQMVNDLNALRSPEEPMVTVESLRTMDRLPHIGARMKLIKARPGWWAGLPPIEAGMRIFKVARTLQFDCKVLTKGPKSHSLAWKEKLDWAFENLGDEVEVTITFDKSQVYGKFLYDDYLDYNLVWLSHRPRGLVIMPVRKLSGTIIHPQILEYDGTNVDQVVNALRRCKRRLPNEPMEIPR
jgi:hypothetical protein